VQQVRQQVSWGGPAPFASARQSAQLVAVVDVGGGHDHLAGVDDVGRRRHHQLVAGVLVARVVHAPPLQRVCFVVVWAAGSVVVGVGVARRRAKVVQAGQRGGVERARRRVLRLGVDATAVVRLKRNLLCQKQKRAKLQIKTKS
jgi:hypothetical protein